MLKDENNKYGSNRTNNNNETIALVIARGVASLKSCVRMKVMFLWAFILHI